jgi:hypothetical protein
VSTNMTMQALFTAEEWTIIQSAPICTFLLVASADGDISKFHWGALVNSFVVVRDTTAPEGELCREVMASIAEDYRTIFHDVVAASQQGRTPQSMLVDVARILQKAPTDQATTFRVTLVQLGQGIARSSKLFSSKISPTQAAVIEDVAIALGFG